MLRRIVFNSHNFLINRNFLTYFFQLSRGNPPSPEFEINNRAMKQNMKLNSMAGNWRSLFWTPCSKQWRLSLVEWQHWRDNWLREAVTSLVLRERWVKTYYFEAEWSIWLIVLSCLSYFSLFRLAGMQSRMLERKLHHQRNWYQVQVTHTALPNSVPHCLALRLHHIPVLPHTLVMLKVSLLFSSKRWEN